MNSADAAAAAATTATTHRSLSRQDVIFFMKGHVDLDDEQAPRFRDFLEYNQWIQIQREIVATLSTSSFRTFLNCIDEYKKKKNNNSNSVVSNMVGDSEGKFSSEIEGFIDEILNCTDDQKKEFAEQKRKKNLHSGTRIRYGNDKGWIHFVISAGLRYGVTLDKATNANPHFATVETIQSNDERLVPLCAFCDENDGIYSCSKCQKAFYCGRECQKNAWSKHKKTCGKPDTNSFCVL